MKYKIIPTLIAKNQKELDNLMRNYSEHFNYFQIDVMDGRFVKNKSNWFKFKLNKKYKYEAHLMVDKPEEWIKKYYKHFQVLIANFERVKDPLGLIQFVKSKNKKIGFALNPATSVKDIIPYLNYLDMVLILAVYPGQYGAKFLNSTYKKIKLLRRNYDGIIEVDGHEDPMHINKLKKFGANYFAVGSYLKSAKNLDKAVIELKKSLK